MIMTAQDDDDYYYCTAYSIAHCYVALVLIDLRIGILTGKRCALPPPKKRQLKKRPNREGNGKVEASCKKGTHKSSRFDVL